MRLTCPHCQKAHHLKPDKIPAGAKHARCQACGDLIPLPDQQDADKPTFLFASTAVSIELRQDFDDW